MALGGTLGTAIRFEIRAVATGSQSPFTPQGGAQRLRRWLRMAVGDIGIVVLTMDSDDDSVFAALRVGARGYLLKEADGDDVHRALLGVARGEAMFGPGIAQPRSTDNY